MTHAGIVSVAEMYLQRFPKFMPPEHHVRAMRLPKNQELAIWRMHDVIVEGPDLPEWSDRLVDPERVRLELEVVHHEKFPRIGMFGAWIVGEKRSQPWLIKEYLISDFANGETGVSVALLEEFYHGGSTSAEA
jgi:hypothetical protein